MTDRFRLLVFDWDGTLIDSQSRIVAAMQAAFADRGLPSRDERAVSNIIGLGLDEAILSLFPSLAGADVQAVRDSYRTHFFGDAVPRSELFADTVEVLETLGGAGYTMAVATGKSRKGLDRELGQYGLGGYFAASRCADETASKPHPHMLNELMSQFDCRPCDTLMIGDTVYDLEMAANAGAVSLGVSYGVHDRARLLQCGPLACLDTLRELPGFLAGGRE